MGGNLQRFTQSAAPAVDPENRAPGRWQSMTLPSPWYRPRRPTRTVPEFQLPRPVLNNVVGVLLALVVLGALHRPPQGLLGGREITLGVAR